MRARALALGAAGLLLLAGCGDAPGYDHAAVEGYLVSSQSTALGGAKVTGASCPHDRSLREGMSLTCTLAVSGTKLPYRVRLTHVHARRIRVTATPDGVLVDGSKLVAYVRSTLPHDATGATVRCGAAYVVTHVGDSLTCTMVLGSQQKDVKLKVTDPSGTVSLAS